MITSLTNAKIKNFARLSMKKDRDKTGLFLAEGIHMIEEARKAGILQEVLQTESLPVLEGVPTEFCSRPVLDKLSSNKSGTDCIGVCRKPVHDKTDGSRILMLERVQDPGNVGTLIRSAYAFGADLVILSEGCADPWSAKALQSSKGAVFHIPVLSCPLTEKIQALKEEGTEVFATALHQDSVNLHNVQVPDKWALVIGNEGQGLSSDVLQACTRSVFIEMQDFESLNAAVAGSIALYRFQFKNEGPSAC
ncbi:MAG: RNA methyltransferase [Erysipelotrichaceae bacterium]|nr:RNA methyltransferase [Erysipelotrichaceae bacterium]